MSPVGGPTPQVGRTGYVTLNNVPLQLVPSTYSVEEAERFAQKISQGAVKYADFNVYEAPWEITSFDMGYGLRRYSDLPLEDTLRREMYNETENVDCRESGLAILSPAIRTTTNLSAEAVWIGEFTPSSGGLAGTEFLVVIAGAQVYTMNADRTLTARVALPATPRRGTIGVFDGHLIIGYGATRTAQYTDDLITLGDVANSTPANLYVYAFTSDHASAYVAGGPAAANVNTVTSSVNGISAYSTSPVSCGSDESEITALAPGGGLVEVFVGKETELGFIDNDSLYRQAVPFDSRLSTNCQGMRWWMAGPSSEQRGPVVLFFPREYSLWAYQPSSESAGTAQNVSPWAIHGIRPENARGRITAIQGSARWLYYAIRGTTSSETWIVTQDSRSAAVHTVLALGENNCNAMTISAVPTGSPLLIYGYGNFVGTSTLPPDGDSPLDFNATEYALTGTLTTADIDLDLPDEQKILFTVRVVADNLIAGSRTILVEASYDGGAWETVGTVNTSPVQEIDFPSDTSVRRVRLRFTFSTDSPASTPQLRGVVLRTSVNPRLYRIWNFQARLRTGLTNARTQDLLNPYTVINEFWDARSDGVPVDFIDRWGDAWTVRILGYSEMEPLHESNTAPETVLQFRLLEVRAGSPDAPMIWDDALAVWDSDTALWG